LSKIFSKNLRDETKTSSLKFAERQNSWASFDWISANLLRSNCLTGAKKTQALAFWTFSRFILETSVVGLIRNNAAAPSAP